MRVVRCAFVVVLFSVLLIVGCGLTAEQRQRLEQLEQENIALVEKQRSFIEKLRAGTASQAEVAAAFASIGEQMKKNAEEVKAIKDSSSTGTWITAALALFGRTALHAAGAMIPGGTPVAGALQGLLTLLLGGSETKRKEGAVA